MPSYKTIVALAGKAGAGKDTILRYLCDHYDVHEIVSCTTSRWCQLSLLDQGGIR